MAKKSGRGLPHSKASPGRDFSVAPRLVGPVGGRAVNHEKVLGQNVSRRVYGAFWSGANIINDVAVSSAGGAFGHLESFDIRRDVGIGAGSAIFLLGFDGPLLLGSVNLPQVVDAGIFLRC